MVLVGEPEKIFFIELFEKLFPEKPRFFPHTILGYTETSMLSIQDPYFMIKRWNVREKYMYNKVIITNSLRRKI